MFHRLNSWTFSLTLVVELKQSRLAKQIKQKNILVFDELIVLISKWITKFKSHMCQQLTKTFGTLRKCCENGDRLYP